MKHFMFDRTERLFGRGQAALRAREFERAADLFQAAIATDPEYAHLHMYLGIAEGERGKLASAVAALQQAMALDPQSFVFPMELGIRHLDAGDPGAALPLFEKAQALAPDSLLVRSYVKLASAEVRGETLEELVKQLRDVPSSFRPRLLVAVMARALRSGGVRPEMLEAYPEEDSVPAAPGAEPSRRERSRLERQIRKAQRSLERGEFEDALVRLLPLRAATTDPRVPVIVGDASHGFLRQLDEKLASVEADERAARRGLSGLVRAALDRRPLADRVAERRRNLWLVMSQVHAERTSDDGGQYEALKRWWQSFVQSHRPRTESAMASVVLVLMARIEAIRGQHGSAVARCAEARELQPQPERRRQIDWVDAVAHGALGNWRAARHLFADALDGELHPIEVHLERIIKLCALVCCAVAVLTP